jgi:hypothetical protein
MDDPVNEKLSLNVESTESSTNIVNLTNDQCDNADNEEIECVTVENEKTLVDTVEPIISDVDDEETERATSKKKTSVTIEDVEDSSSDVEFDVPDTTTKRSNDVDLSKYTVVDNLDEDEPIPGQLWCLMSFISPEGVMNCTIRGVKVRGVYGTKQEAEKAAEKIRKKDKYFDVFVGEVGKWLAWDPDPMTIKDARYGNKKLNKVMKAVHEQNNKKLNELVGRKKDTINQSKKTHKQRVSSSIKNSGNAKDESSDDEPVIENKLPPQKKNNHDGSNVRARIKQKMLKKQQAEREQKELDRIDPTKHVPAPAQSEDKFMERAKILAEESDRLIQKETDINQLSVEQQKIQENLNRMKALYNNAKRR